MQVEIKVPKVGESVREGILAQWFKADGEMVRKGELLYLLETDKITLEISAEADGILKILVPEGQTVAVGEVIATLETGSAEAVVRQGPPAEAPPQRLQAEPSEVLAPVEPSPPVPDLPEQGPWTPLEPHAFMTPSVRKLAEEKGVDLSRISGSGPGGRVTRGDILLFVEESDLPGRAAKPGMQAFSAGLPDSREPAMEGAHPVEETSRKPMSPIRQRIAERLVAAKQNTASLTTFNEIDMTRVQELRARYKDVFRERYGFSLGIMSFFVRASVEALKAYPEVNAFIDGKDVVYHHYVHMGIAVGGGKGLVVPVIRHAERLGFQEIEQAIAQLVQKVKDNRLELSDLEGGTFTITNGGVYGSLLSTPLLNSPQSGILGMHRIDQRPVAMGGQVVVRPMMYVALTYDHRIVDGREAVSFLKRIKECVEDPERIMLEI